MPARKRDLQELEASDAPKAPSVLDRLRNMWHFANLAQYLFIFGKAVRVDENIGIEVRDCHMTTRAKQARDASGRAKVFRPQLTCIQQDLEMECVKPEPSSKLAEIGLALLKFVSSHRGLTPELFDEHTRRQYVARDPMHNPFGEAEEPAKFNSFDVFTKVCWFTSTIVHRPPLH